MPTPAGYGVAEFTLRSTTDADCVPMAQLIRRNRRMQSADHTQWGALTWVHSGQVQTDAKQRDYIGARAQTNNTGELSAMSYALDRALGRPTGEGGEIIWSDSLYTINMTTGRWRLRTTRNRRLVARIKEQWRKLQRRRPNEVELRHVRSHTLVPGNEVADWLADGGAHGAGDTLDSALRQLTRWFHSHSIDISAGARRRQGSEGVT